MWILTLQGQGLQQLEELGLAVVLSALVGLEREMRQKTAGLRTYTLVGVSAALFMLISKYGYTDVLENGRVVLDPSRVAAQIVSGIGFIGGGVIFLRRDTIKGLTTAMAAVCCATSSSPRLSWASQSTKLTRSARTATAWFSPYRSRVRGQSRT